MFKMTVVFFLLLTNLGHVLASGSESSSGGNTREKDSSRDELRASMRERLRAKRQKENKGEEEKKSQKNENENNSPEENEE